MRVELCVIVIKDLEVVQLTYSHNKVYHLRIRYINIDNNTSYDALMPTVLTTPLRWSH